MVIQHFLPISFSIFMSHEVSCDMAVPCLEVLFIVSQQKKLKGLGAVLQFGLRRGHSRATATSTCLVRQVLYVVLRLLPFAVFFPSEVYHEPAFSHLGHNVHLNKYFMIFLRVELHEQQANACPVSKWLGITLGFPRNRKRPAVWRRRSEPVRPRPPRQYPAQHS